MKKKILIVEDEKDIVKLLRYNLENNGYKVVFAHDGETGFSLLRTEQPDLVILDLMLPKLDGHEFLKMARRDGNVPILVLTAKKEEVDKLLGLELGADDYVTKPFSVREVMARIKTILRRTDRQISPSRQIAAGNLTVDLDRYEVKVKDELIPLSTKEFEFLKCLIEADGRALTRDDILARVWGVEPSMELDTRTIDQHVSRLREKLGCESHRILTVKNIGYRIKID